MFIAISNDKRLEEFIFHSSLSESDKVLWSNFIPICDQNSQETLLTLFSAAPETLAFITDNLRKKVHATTSQDVRQLENVVNEEVEVLNSYS